MRIAISGPQGSGKTTLIKEMEKDPFFSEFEFLPEVVRTLKAKYDFKINEQASLDTEMIIFTQHVQNLILKDNFISDRCLIDNYVYSSLLNDFNKEEVVSQSYLDSIKYLMKLLLPKYDIIFFIPNEFDVSEDGVRNIDPLYLMETQLRFLEVIEEVFPNRIVLSGSVSERLHIIKNEVNMKKGIVNV